MISMALAQRYWEPFGQIVDRLLFFSRLKHEKVVILTESVRLLRIAQFVDDKDG